MHAVMAKLTIEETDLLERSIKKAKTNEHLPHDDMQIDVATQPPIITPNKMQNERKSFRDSLLGYEENVNQDRIFNEEGIAYSTKKMRQRLAMTRPGKKMMRRIARL